MAQKAMQKSMAAQKVAAYVSLAQKNESLWNGILIFLGALMLLGTIPFYPIYLVFLLAAACGVIGFKRPEFGLIGGVLLGLLAVVYQSPVFAWFYLLILVVLLFEVFEAWLIIVALEIFILAPFAFGGLPFSGWITIIGMAIGSLYFGSKKSLSISLTSITLILMLSSVWLVQNTAYLPLNMDLYQPGKAELLLTKQATDLGSMGAGLADGLGMLFDMRSITNIWDSVWWVAVNVFIMLDPTKDSLLLQLMGWTVSLFLLG